jgi:hypothetical protein
VVLEQQIKDMRAVQVGRMLDLIIRAVVEAVLVL